jgi:hypothetical protein
MNRVDKAKNAPEDGSSGTCSENAIWTLTEDQVPQIDTITAYNTAPITIYAIKRSSGPPQNNAIPDSKNRPVPTDTPVYVNAGPEWKDCNLA